MNIPPDEILHIIVAIAGGTITVAVLLVGYLIRRAIKGVDDSLTVLSARLDGISNLLNDHNTRLVRLETHLGFGVPPPPPRKD